MFQLYHPGLPSPVIPGLAIITKLECKISQNICWSFQRNAV